MKRILIILAMLIFMPGVAAVPNITFTSISNITYGTGDTLTVNASFDERISYASYELNGVNTTFHNTLQLVDTITLENPANAPLENPVGVMVNGTYIWVGDYGGLGVWNDSNIYLFDMEGNYIKNASYRNKGSVPLEDLPYSFDMNDTYMFVFDGWTGYTSGYYHNLTEGTVAAYTGYVKDTPTTYAGTLYGNIFYTTTADTISRTFTNGTTAGSAFDTRINDDYGYSLAGIDVYSDQFWVSANGKDEMFRLFMNNGTQTGFRYYLVGGESDLYIYDDLIYYIDERDFKIYVYRPHPQITPTDGSNTIIIYANDTSGNFNSSTVNFIFDATPPTSSNPVYPSSVPEASSFTIYIDVTDAYDSVDTVTLDIFGSNRTMSNTTDTYSVTVVSPYVTENTEYTLNYYFNDTYGHLDNISYILTVDEISGGGGNGGGAATPPTGPDCGPFATYPDGAIELFSSEGTVSPDVTIIIYNGNTSQTFGINFDYEMRSYCRITEYPTSLSPPNSQTEFSFNCRAPSEVVRGNVLISTNTGCERAIPLTIGPSIGFLAQFGDFVRLVASGSWDSFLISYHGWPVVIIIVFFMTMGLILWKA
jgi:hypothetical protein